MKGAVGFVLAAPRDLFAGQTVAPAQVYQHAVQASFKHRSGLGWDHALGAAFKQGDAQYFLDAGHRLRGGWLGQMHGLCRRADPAVAKDFADNIEIADMRQLDHHRTPDFDFLVYNKIKFHLSGFKMAFSLRNTLFL